MPPNRMVALLTPVVALGAGGAATWLADNLGIQVDPGELQAIFVAAIIAVLAPAAQWLYGSQKFERHQAELEQLALKADMKAAEQASDVEMDATTGAVEDEDVDGEYDDDDDGYDDEYAAADADDDDYDDDYESAREEQPAAY